MRGSWFALELVRCCRHGRLVVLRRIYAAWLVAQWVVLCFNYLAASQSGLQASPAAVSHFVGGYLEIFVVQHFLLLMLVTPPLVAGAIADERTKGTLALLLTTRLTAWEIVIGRLLGRLIQLGYLALVGMPFLCFMGGYGHLRLSPLLALPVVTVGLAFALGAAGLLASVRSAQTRDAVVRMYLWCVLALTSGASLAWGLGQVIPLLRPGGAPHTWSLRAEAALHWLSPLYVLDTFWEGSSPATLARRVLTAVLAWGIIGAALLGLAVWRFRPTSLRLLDGRRRGRGGGRPRLRAPVDDEPVRWKERVVAEAAILSGWSRVPRWLGVAVIFGSTLGLSWAFLQQSDPERVFLVQGLGMMFLFSLIMGIRTSGAISGERERQTWEALLLTPLTNEEIVWGKFQGIAEAVAPYVLAYLIPALALAAWAGAAAFTVTASLAVVTSAGMYYMGATGIWWSVQLRSSWQSLLATLVSGYASAAGLILLLVIPVMCLSCLSAVALFTLEQSGIRTPDWALHLLVSIVGSVTVAAFLVRRARRRVADAERCLEMERDGRTFGRVLARALRKHADRLQGRAPARTQEPTS